MDTLTLTAAKIRQALPLLERKEALQAELALLEEKLANLSSLDSHASKEPAKVGRRGRGKRAASSAAPAKAPVGRRGGLKNRVIEELSAAGQEGLSLQDLAQKLGAKSTNLSAWFATTGKRVPGLKRVGRGMYKFNG